MVENHKEMLIKPIGVARFVVVENHLFRVLFGVVLFLVLMAVFLLIGLMIGYSVIGDGAPLDVFKWSTWDHILKFLK